MYSLVAHARSIVRLVRRLRRRLRPRRLDSILDIHGWTLEAQLRYLMRAVRRVPDGGVIVELGVWQGRSALAMGEACCGTRKRVYAVDPWCDYRQGGVDVTTRLARWDLRSFDEVYERFLGHRRRLGLEAWVVPVRAPSLEAAKAWSHGPVSLLFVDGNHDYDAVIADLEAWTPLMAPGGTITGDDWNWDIVRSAVTDFVARRGGWRVDHPCENTWAFVTPA